MLNRRYNAPIVIIQQESTHHIAQSRARKYSDLQWLISLLLIVLVWYSASTLSATSSQFFIQNLQENKTISWPEKIFAMVFTTWLQLMVGSIVGFFIMVVIHRYYGRRWVQMKNNYFFGLFPALHSGGSLFTNLGYAFLSASWVQIIKLTEPVQTLIVDFFLRKLWGIPRHKIKVSVVCFVMGTVFVLRQRSSSHIHSPTTNVWGVPIVILSGCLLSTRNVIKKIKHMDKGNGLITGPVTSNMQDTLQEGLSDFIHLSHGGSILLLPVLIATSLGCMISGTRPFVLFGIMSSAVSSPAMIISHPAYNLASLLVLSFVSAPVHSLLNSAKRIVCTLTVSLWFGEPLTLQMILGLSLITIALKPTWTNKDRFLGVAIAAGLYFSSLMIPNSGSVELSNVIDHFNETSIARPYSFFDDQKLPIKNCTTRFKQNRMYLCHLIPYGGNFGDEIGPAVITKLIENKYGCSFNDIPVLNLAQYDRWDNAICLFSLGSIFHRIRNHDHVWGTGINPYWLKSFDNKKNVSFYAVRGPKSEAIIREKLGENKSLGQGDPGFLIPFLYPEYRLGSKPKYQNPPRICFVPHSHDKNYEELNLYPSIHVIQVNNSWNTVVNRLMDCDYVGSSSLHGIIVADSMGIPTRWFQFEETDTIVTEGVFKYEDYFESINRKNQVPISQFRQALNLSVYNHPIELQERVAIAKRTLSSFPYHLFTSEPKPRTLVIMIGSLRGGELAWESFYENMLLPNAADLALLVPSTIARNSSSLFNHATYVWTHREYDDWGDAIDEFIGGDGKWREIAKREKDCLLFGGAKIEGASGSGAVIFMLRFFLSKILIRDGIIDKYDRFVVTRSDHYYGCVHDLDLLDSHYLWVPSGEDYGGITDRHAVMNSRHILKALDVFPPVVREPEKYIGVVKNPERLIKKRWQEEGLWPWVRRFDRMMFTCADTGDTTRWMARTSNRSPEGVYLKYFQEYNETKFTCEGKYILSKIE